MLIQWRDGQQTFQNVYYIFTSKNHLGSRMGFERDEEERFEIEMNANRPSTQKEVLVEYEEDKYEMRIKFA